MASIPSLVGGPANAVAFNVTTYTSPFVLAVDTTEANRHVRMRSAGTITHITMRVSAHTIATSNTVVTLMVNGVASSLAFNIAAGAGAGEYGNTGSVSIAAGDYISLRIVTPNTSGSISFTGIGCLFAATANSVTRVAHRNGGFAIGASTNGTWSLGGAVGFVATGLEADVQLRMRAAFTLKNFYQNIVSNASGLQQTFRVRKNGANGNQVIVLAAGATTPFEDTSNTDSVVNDDLVNFWVESGGGTGDVIAFGTMGSVEIESVNNQTFTCASPATTPLTAGTTAYGSLSGDSIRDAFTTESHYRQQCLAAFDLSKLQVYVQSPNAVSNTSTITVRKDGADTALAVSIASSLTGWFEDASNTVSFASGEAVNLKAVIGAGGTTLPVMSVSTLMTRTGLGGAGYTPRSLLLGVG